MHQKDWKEVSAREMAQEVFSTSPGKRKIKTELRWKQEELLAREAQGLGGKSGAGAGVRKEAKIIPKCLAWMPRRRKVQIETTALVPGGRRVLTRKSLTVCPLTSSHGPCIDTPGFQPVGFYSSSFLVVLILVTPTALLVDLIWFLGSFLVSCLHVILQLKPGSKPNTH